MTADIIDLPHQDDETIPVVFGVPLIDADPAVIARRLRRKSWPDRAKFFNNITADSLERMTWMVEHAVSEDDQQAHLDWNVLKMHERIGQVIDLWGEAKPSEDLAAAIYVLSLNPQHRRAASEYFKDRSADYLSDQVRGVMARLTALRMFYNLSLLFIPSALATDGSCKS